MFYADMVFCLVFGVLAVISNLLPTVDALACSWSPLYITTLLSALSVNIATRVWSCNGVKGIVGTFAQFQISVR